MNLALAAVYENLTKRELGASRDDDLLQFLGFAEAEKKVASDDSVRTADIKTASVADVGLSTCARAWDGARHASAAG